MMGVSPYKTRTELLHERFTGMTKDIDATTQARFDDGHRFEVLALPLAEEIIGESLYPITGSREKLSASFDGLTLDDNVSWEHKSLNDTIRAATCAADLAEYLRVQMEQQLAVSEAERCLFMASKWDANGELVEEVHHWYEPDLALRQRIIAGWAQFEIDLANYVPKELVEKPKAEAIMQLPALAIQIRGEVTLSNLPAFKAAAEQFIANIKTDLQTDADFSDAEATVKYCAETEKKLELAKASAIAQTASIDELMRTIDHIQAQLRDKRLTLDKLVKSQKEVIKTGILSAAQVAYADHIAGLEAEIKPIRLICDKPDFAGAMKAKRTLASLHDAVDGELANARITADAAAKDIRAKLAWCKTNADGYGFLFSDLQSIIQKPIDDFQLMVTTRIEAHKKAEAEKLEAERAKIAEEERIKAEKAALEKVNAQLAAEQAERDRIAALERSRQREAETLQRAAEKPSIAMFGGMPGEDLGSITISPDVRPAPVDSGAKIKLGEICSRLGFTITADFLAARGFPQVGREGASKLYRACDFQAICQAIVHHVQAVGAEGLKQAA